MDAPIETKPQAQAAADVKQEGQAQTSSAQTTLASQASASPANASPAPAAQTSAAQAPVSKGNFDWTGFYQEFADKLLQFKNDRTALLQKVENVYTALQREFPFDNPQWFNDIDPFTILGNISFDRDGLVRAEKQDWFDLLSQFAKEFDIKAPVPTSNDGYIYMFQHTIFMGDLRNKKKYDAFYDDIARSMGFRGEHDIDNLWTFFELALNYADTPEPGESAKQELIKAYDEVFEQPFINFNLSIALYWIRPYAFLSLDRCTRKYIAYLQEQDAIPLDCKDSLSKLMTFERSENLILLPPNGAQYFQLTELFRSLFKRPDFAYEGFPDFVHQAWLKEDADKRKAWSESWTKLRESNFLERLQQDRLEHPDDEDGRAMRLGLITVVEDDDDEVVREIEQKREAALEKSPLYQKLQQLRPKNSSTEDIEDADDVKKVEFTEVDEADKADESDKQDSGDGFVLHVDSSGNTVLEKKAPNDFDEGIYP